MKKLWYVVILGIVTSCSTSSENRIPVADQKMFRCLEGIYADHGYNLNVQMDLLEASLIDQGFLLGKGGEHYAEMIRDIAVDDLMPVVPDSCIKGLLLDPMVLFGNACIDSFRLFDSEEVKRSNYAMLHKKVEEEIKSKRVSGEHLMAKAAMKILSHSDFEQPLVRYHVLLSLVFQADLLENKEQGIVRMLPPKPREGEGIEQLERNIVRIHLNSKDELFVDEEHFEFEELKDFVKEKIQDHSNLANAPEVKKVDIEGLGEREVSQVVFMLTNSRSTTYEAYIKVNNALELAVLELRNEISRQEFGVSYDELTEQSDKLKIRAVRQLVPKSIQESQPIDD